MNMSNKEDARINNSSGKFYYTKSTLNIICIPIFELGKKEINLVPFTCIQQFLGVVVHASHPSTLQAEAEGWLQVQGQPCLYGKKLPQKINK